MAKLSSYSVPALDKGLDVLETLAASRSPQSLTALGQILNRSPSELFRILNCLESRDYIRRDPNSGCYSLTLKLYELAHTHSPVEQILFAAARPMRELTNEAEESCHLSMLSRGGQLILAQTVSPKPIHLSIEVGGRFPAISTGSGRLLLAYLPQSDWAEFQETDASYGKLSRAQKQQLQTRLQKIRAQGYSSSPSEMVQGVYDLAVPVGNAEIGPLAVLAIPLFAPPGQSKDLNRLIPMMKLYAVSITKAVGLNSQSS